MNTNCHPTLRRPCGRLLRLLTLLFPALLLFAARPAAADLVRITEVVVDPQRDHSESTGGDGVPFLGDPGTGTVSSVDEYLELHRFAAPDAAPLDLTGWSLDFIDTTPSRYVFGTTSANTTFFSPGSSLTALAPSGFVVVGNPPGALNNKVRIEVRNPLGTLIDLFEVLDGNASSALDEAVLRDFDSDGGLLGVGRGSASPLAGTFAPRDAQPTPEPGTLILVAVGVTFFVRRRRRRGAAERGRREERINAGGLR